jgi:hypothetical protein
MSMKRKSLVIGGIAVTAALAGGLALAQTVGPGSGGEGMGPGMMMKGMGHGMGHGMGPGMMMNGMGHGMGPGMMMNGMGHGMGHGMGPGMMQGGPASGFADPAGLDQLKTELGIKPAQEQAWNTYAKAVGDAAAAQKTTAEGVDRQALGKMKPADRFAYINQDAQNLRPVRSREGGRRRAAGPRRRAEGRGQEIYRIADQLRHDAGAGMGGPQHRH